MMISSFDAFGFAPSLVATLSALGYENPTPVQAQSIPILLNGQDLLAQAQTGTGKTAAFALPILTRLDMRLATPQALIMTPTRELALQVSNVFKRYGAQLPGLTVAPIYGGQDYRTQLRLLKQGAHVVVGTPGRLMDLLRRGAVDPSTLKTVILDEGDEMLKMGFIDDITWILEQIPKPHQTALFSATLPNSIKQIVNRYLVSPKKVHIESQQASINTIEQSYVCVHDHKKLEALLRFLEIESFHGVIIFTRTKQDTLDLTQKLQRAGYASDALNGDLSQGVRERVIAKLKKGDLDIVVATDVAARGIDVSRITHVINFDFPHNPEAYVHRIGRTGRAGRQGSALLFISPKERRAIEQLERTTRQKIREVFPPTAKEITEKRALLLADSIKQTIHHNPKLPIYQKMVDRIVNENQQYAPEDIAAALACLLEQHRPVPEHDIETPASLSHKPPSKKRFQGGKPAFEHKRQKDKSHREKSYRSSDKDKKYRSNKKDNRSTRQTKQK